MVRGMARKSQGTVQSIPDPDKVDPKDTPEFLERGWLYYSQQKYESAEADIGLVLQREPNNIDALFALGLTLKALQKPKEAIEAFSRIDPALPTIEDHQRAIMIARLAHGHINHLRSGEWNLEKEVWKSKP
jgi:tetratricopeptide (TPR) repeat protein